MESAPLLLNAEPVVGLPVEARASLLVPFHQRTRKDMWFAVAWAVSYVVVLICGIATFANRNTKFAEQMSVDYLSNSDNCPLNQPSGRRSLLGMRSLLDEDQDPTDVGAFVGWAVTWLILSVLASLGLGVLFVYLVKQFPKTVVGLAITVQVLLPLASGIVCFAAGGVGGGISMFIIAALLGLMFWLWRQQLKLVVSLLSVSARGMRENLGLVGASLGIQAGLFFLMVPLYISITAALTNGHVAYNYARDPLRQDGCFDAVTGDVVSCCVWEVDGHVIPIIFFSVVAIMWTSFVGSEVRTFTVAGTIAQWYFAPVNDPKPKGGKSVSWVKQALHAALTTSFGSLCMGALILTVVQLMRNVLEKLRRDGQRNILLWCLSCIISFILDMIEFVTKFATIRLALTGEGFWEATKNVSDLLKRNFLDAFGVWWLPSFILHMASMVMAIFWSVILYFSCKAAFHKLDNTDSFAMVLAWVSFLWTWLVLAFFVSLLLNIIDSIYLCFAMDRDNRICSHQDVHEVYSKLPSVGPVIQNPDGGLAYATPDPNVPPRQQHASV